MITVREQSGWRNRWTSSSPRVTLSPTWQPLALDYVTHAAGSSLDLRILDEPTRRRETFQVDAVSIVVRTSPGPVVPDGIPDPAASADEAVPASDEVGPVPAESAVLARLGVSPNPFRGDAQLSFATSRPGPVSIRVFDLSGRMVRTLLDQASMSTGLHSVALDGRRTDGSRLGAGLYFYQVRSSDGLRTGRFVVMK
jgi:hypothetical protein